MEHAMHASKAESEAFVSAAKEENERIKQELDEMLIKVRESRAMSTMMSKQFDDVKERLEKAETEVEELTAKLENEKAEREEDAGKLLAALGENRELLQRIDAIEAKHTEEMDALRKECADSMAEMQKSSMAQCSMIRAKAEQDVEKLAA